jgi:hypothetical protein
MPGDQFWVVFFGVMVITQGFGAPQAAPNEPQGGAHVARAARLKMHSDCPRQPLARARNCYQQRLAALPLRYAGADGCHPKEA